MRLIADRVTASRDSRVSDTGGPRIYLHIGEPKTGTTFLQDALWNNRARLGVQGFHLPGYSDRDHSRASRDLRETPRPASDPADPWTGEWDVLAGQALRARERAVISNEVLAASSPQQAERGVRSLLRGDLHVVATVRNFASLLPAEWQEAVKCRGTIGWEAWLDAVIAAEGAADRRSQSWFWRVHDTLAILDMWSRYIPPDQVHVVTVPHQDPGNLLWTRFAAAMGIDPGGCDLTQGRRNSSLGYAETEFLRRMNESLPPGMPDWFYVRQIKQILAHGVLSDRPHRARMVLPPSYAAWAAGQAEILLEGLRDAKYHVVGDLADLRPAGEAGLRSQRPAGQRPAGQRPAGQRPAGPGPAGQAAPPPSPAAQPAEQPTEQQLDAAVQAAVALADRYYQALHPVRQREPRRTPRRRASDIKWAVLNGPVVKRALRRASHRPAVVRLRVLIWCALMRPGRRRPR